MTAALPTSKCFLLIIAIIVIVFDYFVVKSNAIRLLATKQQQQLESQQANATYETILVDLGGNLKIHAISAFEGNQALYATVPDYSNFYYYRYIEEKLLESLSVSNCTIWGSKRFSLSPFTSPLVALSKVDADLIVEQVIPPDYVLNNWGSDGMKKVNNYDLYVGISKNLSHRKGFKGIRKGTYLRAKGCANLLKTPPSSSSSSEREDITTSSTSTTTINKLLLSYHANFHPSHVRCNPFALLSAFPAEKSGEFMMSKLPKVYQSLHTFPFIIKAKNVIVAKSGMLALKCGAFGLLSSCNSVNWGLKVLLETVKVEEVHTCSRSSIHTTSSSSSSSSSASCPYRYFDKVFVVTQYDDTQIGQFLLESFPKLVLHLDFLYANPDVYIHFGFSKNKVLPSYVLPHLYFNWLGLGHRLINGTIFAKEVFMPREGGCQDAGYNAWEIVSMRDRLIRKVGLNSSDDEASPSISEKPTIVIIERVASSAFTQNKYDGPARRWPKGFLSAFIELLEAEFTGHIVQLFSDRNTTQMTCPECHIKLFRRADVVISFHGAGMTNTMYMRPGGVVVEVVSFYDSRHVPMTGIFPRLSAIIGLHHYTHYVNGPDLVSKQAQDATPVIDPKEFIKDIVRFRSSALAGNSKK